MAHIPYGYEIVNGDAKIIADEQANIIRLYETFISGASYRLCREASGIPRTEKGCRAILCDRTYLGTDFYPPLLDTELFQLAQAEFARRPKNPGGRKKRKPLPIQTTFNFDPTAMKHMGTELKDGGQMQALVALHDFIVPMCGNAINDTS